MGVVWALGFAVIGGCGRVTTSVDRATLVPVDAIALEGLWIGEAAGSNSVLVVSAPDRKGGMRATVISNIATIRGRQTDNQVADVSWRIYPLARVGNSYGIAAFRESGDTVVEQADIMRVDLADGPDGPTLQCYSWEVAALRLDQPALASIKVSGASAEVVANEHLDPARRQEAIEQVARLALGQANIVRPTAQFRLVKRWATDAP